MMRRRRFSVWHLISELFATARKPDAKAPVKATFSETPPGPGGKDAELYSRIQDIMENEKPYLDPGFRISDLSSMLGTNRTYTSRAVNRMSGRPFRQWLTELRINDVTKYIEDHPDANIDMLCNAGGYENISTLYHNFKKVHGVTMSEYARRVSRNPLKDGLSE